MLTTNLNNSFIYYECRYSFTFVNWIFCKPLNSVPNRNMTSFIVLEDDNALDVFLKLKPRKYKYKEYITTIVYVLVLSNRICILD